LKSSNKMSPFTSYKQLSKSLNIWLIEIPANQTTSITLKKENRLISVQKHPK